MLKKIKTISNRLLAVGMVVAVLIVILIGLDFYQKLQQKQGLDGNELLKAPKEKIINYEVKPAENPDTGENSDGIVIYRYVSNKEVPAETYQGLEEDISKRTPNSLTFLKSIKPIDEKTQLEEYVAKFYTAPTFQKDGDKWYQVETATTTPSAFASQTKLTLLDQVKKFFGQKALADTFYAGGGDGDVYKADSQDWNTTHNETDGQAVCYTGGLCTSMKAQAGYDVGYYYWNRRAFLPFDTSAIPASATINSAILSIYVASRGDYDNDGLDYINVVQTTQPDSTALTTADYDTCGATHSPTTGATAIDLTAGFTTSAYNNFTLNTTGLTWIAKSGVTSACGTTVGVTCLGLREGHDLTDTATDIMYLNGITFSASETTGTSQDPYLTVAYTTIPSLRINGGNIRINGGNVRVDSSN